MKFVKKFFAFLLCVCILFVSSVQPAAAASYKINFSLNSEAVYFVNLDTQTVMYEQNANAQFSPGALVDIMTAIVTLEYCESNGISLETTVTAPSYIYDEFDGLGVSTADVRRGEEVRIIDLLYGLMLQSACEAASILADYIGNGQISTFVEMMNAKAKEIGTTNTYFTNPHGLTDPKQVTTAYDMALITQYAIKNEQFTQIATTVSYQMPATNIHSEPRYVIHSNYMLSSVRGGEYYYKPAKGIKTGALADGSRSLVSMAESDGYRYLLVTISAPDRNASFADALRMYQWAFSSFSLETIVKAGETVDEIPVTLSSKQDYVQLIAKEDVMAILPKGTDASALKRVIKLVDDARAPIEKGDLLGRMELKLADDVVASVDLVASETVSRNIFLYMGDVLWRFFTQPLILVLCVLLGLLLVVLFSWIAQMRKNRRRRAERVRKFGK